MAAEAKRGETVAARRLPVARGETVAGRQISFALVAFVLFLVPAALFAAPPSTCGATDPYGRALCAYQRRQFGEAEKGFRAIVDAGAEAPETLHAMYFLARTEMKTGRFDDAGRLFVRIYELDPSFYREWNGDFLLGECRRAAGKN